MRSSRDAACCVSTSTLGSYTELHIPNCVRGPGNIHKPFLKAGQSLDWGFQCLYLFRTQLDTRFISLGQQRSTGLYLL